jgi:hypothetical protein
MDNNVERKNCSFCGVRGKKGMRFGGGMGAMICESCVEQYHEAFQSSAKTRRAAEAPWESMTDAEVLSNLPMISQTADQVSEFLVEWVALARSRKISWAQIGNAFGVSRQAVWERFAQRVEAVNARSDTA